MLAISNLNKSYGKKTALNNLSLNLESGRIVGLVGPNGSGKTTLLKILGGFDSIYNGEIFINDEALSYQTKAYTSYLPDRPSLPTWMSLEQAINLYHSFFQDFDMEKAFKMLQDFKLDKNQKINTLSKGMQEKLQILLTISRNAKLYLLDEPISGVDPAARKIIIKTILTNFNENSLMIISTHLLDDIENIIDEVIFLEEGQIKIHALADDLRGSSGKNLKSLFEEIYA